VTSIAVHHLRIPIHAYLLTFEETGHTAPDPSRSAWLEGLPAFDIEHTEHGGGCNTAASMNKAASDRIHELCSLIAVEQDRQKFLELCEELNRILSTKDERLKKGNPGGETVD
jgi:hypothetical protein